MAELDTIQDMTLGRHDPPVGAPIMPSGPELGGILQPPSATPGGSSSVLSQLGIGGIDPSMFAPIPNMSDFTSGLQNSRTGADFLFRNSGDLSSFLNTNAQQEQSQAYNESLMPYEQAMNAQRLKGQSLWGGFAKGAPLMAALLAGPLGGPLAASLGLGGIGGLSAGALGSALISGAGGAISGGENGGLGGALMGALGGGLGSLGGSGLGGLFGGAGGAAGGLGGAAGDLGSAAGAGAGAGLGGAGGAAAGGGAGNLLSALTVTGAGAGGGGLGGAAGGLGGLHFNTNPAGGASFSQPDPNGVATSAPDFTGFKPISLSDVWPTGILGGAGGGLGGPGGDHGGPTEVSPLTVTGGPGPGGINPASILGSVPLTNTPADIPNPTGGPHDKPADFKKFIEDIIKAVGGPSGGFPVPGPGPAPSPGGVIASTPTPPTAPPIGGGGPGPTSPGGGGPPATPTTSPGSPSPTSPMPGIPGPSNSPGGSGPTVAPGLLNVGGGAGGGSGVGAGGPGVDIKGSLSPDIYPWSTGGGL